MTPVVRRFRPMLLLLALLAVLGVLHASPAAAQTDTATVARGTQPFSDVPDTAYVKKHFFPLLQDKLRARGISMRNLPPPYGIMLINNWMDSDWRFQSAAVSLGGSNPITIDAAKDATMDLNIGTRGFKADVWVLPFVDVMGGYGDADIVAQLGLRNIPVDFDPGTGYTYADAIIPMEFNGTYYSLGLVVAYAYKHFYGAADLSWVKTSLEGSASLSTDGFWTFTAAPKVGYNAGLSQIYIGARYVSKNEHYEGTVPLPSGNPLGFDVRITTDTWAPNFGMRTVIQEHWEFLAEVAGDPRHQITVGVGYRW